MKFSDIEIGQCLLIDRVHYVVIAVIGTILITQCGRVISVSDILRKEVIYIDHRIQINEIPAHLQDFVSELLAEIDIENNIVKLP